MESSPSPTAPRGIFITGTDTGVGKTFVTALLTEGLKRRGIDTGVMKPIESGIESGTPIHSTDAGVLRQASGAEDPIEIISPYRFEAPASPYQASEIEGRSIDLSTVVECYRKLEEKHSLVLVEGVGGLFVPINRDVLVVDLVKMLGLPMLVVCRPNLGTLNHTLLTLYAARTRGLAVLGLVINQGSPQPLSREETSIGRFLEELGDVPLLGEIPFTGHPTAGALTEKEKESLWSEIHWDGLKNFVPGK